MSATGILQAAATIAKTTQTAVGSVIKTEGYNCLVLYLDYVNGDETGVLVIPSFQRTATGTVYPMSLWSETAGVYSVEDVKYTLVASDNVAVRLNITGIDYVKITQGGSNNDGTPTGTLAVAYTLDNG